MNEDINQLIPDELKDEIAQKLDTMENNTETKDADKGLKFVKTSISAEIVEQLMDHYGFLDVADLNQMAIHILRVFAQIETDGFQLVIYKPAKNDEGKDSYENTFLVDIHQLIASIRIASTKSAVPNIKMPTTKEKDEKNNM